MAAIRHSLAAQFFAAFALVAVLVIALLGALVTISMRDGFSRYLLQGELAHMDGLVMALATAHDPTAPGWPELVSDKGRWHRFVQSSLHTELLERDRGRPPPPGANPFLLEERIFLTGPDTVELIPPLARETLSALHPIMAPDDDTQGPPVGYLGLTAPLGARTQTDQFYLRGQYQNLALASLAALALSAIAAMLLARHLLRPIKAVESGARALASGDFDARIPNSGSAARKDELGQLVHHTNALAQSLQASRDAERQWISDTSHELQTPLAVLRAEIEAMQDGIRQADDKTLTEMHDSVMRLSRLVRDLKTLSFSREGRNAVARRPADVAALLNARLDLAEGRLREAGLSLTRNIEGELTLPCDPDRLGQVIDNLLENTLRYTTAPGEVRVSAWREAGRILANIEDTPPAPPPDAIPNLFDRFYRAEASRSRNLGGSGLGLAICQAIITEHDGEILADTSPLGGLRVRIVLPLEGTIDGSE